jgi:hypothetical protein
MEQEQAEEADWLVIDKREASGAVDAWTEYLCISPKDEGDRFDITTCAPGIIAAIPSDGSTKTVSHWLIIRTNMATSCHPRALKDAPSTIGTASTYSVISCRPLTATM